MRRAIIASIISVGILTACGKTPEAELKNESSDSIVTTSANEEDVNEETSFGLQDFEGLYCRTATEQIEDYEVTYTNGYLFNADGTGISYGQDVVDFTWNETEIHFADSARPFEVEPGKLTVDGITYDKIGGKFITPNVCIVDVDNLDNGIYYAYIDNNSITEADGETLIRAEIYTEESYDIVDIHNMAEGDVIYINGQLLPITSIAENDWGLLEINGGIENYGAALRAIDESNCFMYAGMDDEISYTCHGMVNLGVSDNIKFIDNSDPTEAKEYSGSEAIPAVKEFVKEYPLTCYSCKIIVENGQIVEINRMYRP